jgi:hypothetical protein
MSSRKCDKGRETLPSSSLKNWARHVRYRQRNRRNVACTSRLGRRTRKSTKQKLARSSRQPIPLMALGLGLTPLLPLRAKPICMFKFRASCRKVRSSFWQERRGNKEIRVAGRFTETARLAVMLWVIVRQIRRMPSQCSTVPDKPAWYNFTLLLTTGSKPMGPDQSDLLATISSLK